MKLKSTAFAANDAIPAKYTCDGENISPPLSWDEVPAETQSFALIVDDPDAPGGTFTHWVLFNLPAETRQIPEAASDTGGVPGKNDFDTFDYGGPCPPGGTHRYFFKLYALNHELELEPGIEKADVLRAMESHVLDTAELVGHYSRKR